MKRRLLTAGLILVSVGALLFTYYLIKRHSGSGDWQIEVQGNRILTERDIQEVVSYLLRAAKDGVSAEEIKTALEFNPRIERAQVSVRPGKKIHIALVERELEYLQNEGSGIAEKNSEGKTIVENIAQVHRDFTPDKIIFYLTLRSESMVTPRSDIIRLWKETREKYSFLWQRFAEIEIQPLREKYTPDAEQRLDIWRYKIYSAGLRSCVVYEGRFSEETLRRLWAVYAYLESKLSRAVTLVDLQDNSAIIREMKTRRSETEDTR